MPASALPRLLVVLAALLMAQAAQAAPATDEVNLFCLPSQRCEGPLRSNVVLKRVSAAFVN